MTQFVFVGLLAIFGRMHYSWTGAVIAAAGGLIALWVLPWALRGFAAFGDLDGNRAAALSER